MGLCGPQEVGVPCGPQEVRVPTVLTPPVVGPGGNRKCSVVRCDTTMRSPHEGCATSHTDTTQLCSSHCTSSFPKGHEIGANTINSF